LLTRISELVTNDPRRSDLLGVVLDAALVIRRGEVAWVGEERDLPSRYRELPEIDCEGRAVIPGFVDAHTHLVFAGARPDEYAARLAGATYVEILESGGGITATVTATRRAGVADLLAATVERAEEMLTQGTTTIEIKSGYGLDLATEIVSLEVARQIEEVLPVDVVTTFLGAHQVPPEFANDRDGYLDLIENEMLPAVADLATYCDVFCDRGAFDVIEAERVLKAGKRYGLKPRIHANQLGQTGGVELAAAIGAVTADHLDHLDRGQAELLAASGIVAVLCPTASWSTEGLQAPGSMMWNRGVTVALATDCNPGTSYVTSMQLVIAVACADMGLTLEEALWSATRGGAHALEDAAKGCLAPGRVGDAVVLDADTYRYLGYRPDVNLARMVIKRGDLVAGGLPPPVFA
jgi:imidazolonepropionase